MTIDPADGRDGVAHLVHYLGHLDALKPALTVRQNIEFWIRFWGGGDVAAALERVGLAALENLPVAVPVRRAENGARRWPGSSWSTDRSGSSMNP